MNVLQHHGIKGQKWGVRRKLQKNSDGGSQGSKKGIDFIDHGDGRIEIKKGSKLQRVASVESGKKLSEMSYASLTRKDNNYYVKNWKNNFGKDFNRLTLETANELKSPSVHEASTITLQMYKNNPKLLKDLNTHVSNMWGDDIPPVSPKMLDDIINDRPNSVYSKEYLYLQTNEFLASKESSNIKKELGKCLSEKGYNMLRDENNAGVVSDAPVIIFDSNKNLKVTESKFIDDKMIKQASVYCDAYSKYGEKWMSDNGFN